MFLVIVLPVLLVCSLIVFVDIRKTRKLVLEAQIERDRTLKDIKESHKLLALVGGIYSGVHLCKYITGLDCKVEGNIVKYQDGTEMVLEGSEVTLELLMRAFERKKSEKVLSFCHR